MGMSVDGLISGMSTTETVKQLMQVEALPQQALKNKVALQTKVVSAYQSINSRLASLAVAAKALGSSDTWGSMKATSSSDAAVVSAAPGAAAGSLSFRVKNVAAAHTLTFTAKTVTSVSDPVTSPVMSGSTFLVKLADGTEKSVAPTDKSLQSVVAAINGTADAVYRAAAVQTEPGKYTLQLTAKQSGTAAAFAAAPAGIDLMGASAITTQGVNAKLEVGTTNPYTIESASNTFADVLPGVTVTATREQLPTDPRVTIGLSADADGITAKVQALVDNANVALSEIAAQSRRKNGDVAAGPLVGDSAMRKLTQEILGAVSAGAGSLGSVNAVGVGLDRSGKLTFDKAKFAEAYKTDPAKTQQFFDGYTEKDSKDVVLNPTGKGTKGKFEPDFDTALGLGRRLETVALLASEGVIRPDDPVTKAKQGVLQGLIQRRTDSISDLNKQVSSWDVRLDLRKTALQRQFSNLEVALGKMQQQSSWLAGQLAGLS